MTQPGTPGSLRTGEDWIAREIRDLKRQIRELSAARTLDRAAVGADGTLTVDGTLDVAGDAQIGGTLGIDGTATVGGTLTVDEPGGLIVRDPATNQLVPLAPQIFGIKVLAGGATQNPTVPANTNSGWVFLPGEVAGIASKTGRWLVTSFARVYNGGSGNAAELRTRAVLVRADTSVIAAVHTSSRSMANQPAESVMAQDVVSTSSAEAVALRLQYWIQAGISMPTNATIADYNATALPV